MKSLITRAITGIFLVAGAVVLIYLGGYYLLSAVVILSLIGLYELLYAFNSMGYHTSLAFASLGGIALICASYFGNSETMIIVLSTYTVISLIVMTFGEKFNINDCMIHLLSILYIPLAFSFFINLDKNPLIWLVFICSWGSDTFAYLVGVLFGKHKLIERLSPKKTIEGAIGGMVGSVVLAMIYAYIAGIDNYLVLGLISVIGSLISILGDLCASKIKRMSGIKDFGSIFAGHGGVLDRFDSVLFVAPYLYVVATLIY